MAVGGFVDEEANFPFSFFLSDGRKSLAKLTVSFLPYFCVIEFCPLRLAGILSTLMNSYFRDKDRFAFEGEICFNGD